MAPLNSKTKLIPVTLHSSIHHQAPQRPLVVITHHFGGNEHTSKRHVALLNDLGFDCVTFLFSKVFFGALNHWKTEIDQVLEQNKDREKILMSFSGPAAAALELISDHVTAGRFDVVGFIADSGPFVDARTCTRNMLKQVEGVTNVVKREILLEALMLAWGFNQDQKLVNAAQRLAQRAPELPILSFRGLLDTIVPAERIAPVFDDQGFKNLTVANLETGHLTGLKEMPEAYRRVLAPFLSSWTTH